MLLAERLRKEDEKALVKVLHEIGYTVDEVQQVLEKHLKTQIDVDNMYNCDADAEFRNLVDVVQRSKEFNIVWTKSMKRLYTLVGKCMQHNVRMHTPVIV